MEFHLIEWAFLGRASKHGMGVRGACIVASTRAPLSGAYELAREWVVRERKVVEHITRDMSGHQVKQRMKKTIIFTATWPPFGPIAGDADAGGAENERKGRVPHQKIGPYCQVAVRTLPADHELGGTSGPELTHDKRTEDVVPEVDGKVENTLVMLKQSVLLRSYNSVYLPEDRNYILTLSDCYGFVPTAWSPFSIRTPMPTSVSPFGDDDGQSPERDAWKQACRRGGGDSTEAIRLPFLSFPLSVEFGPETSEANRDGVNVGNFHLFPTIHAPEAHHSSNLDKVSCPQHAMDSCNGRDATTLSSAPWPPCSPPFSARPSAASINTLLPASGGGGSSCGDGGALPKPWMPSFRDQFISGAMVGVLVCLVSAWLVMIKSTRGQSEKRPWAWLKDGNGGEKLAVWRNSFFGSREVEKERGSHVVGDGEKSDYDGSSDNDAILTADVPEPVGLPRSDEDWRALFDTLYEDQALTGPSDIRVAAPVTHTRGSGAGH